MLQEHKFLVIHFSCHRCDSCTYFCSDCSLTFNTIRLLSDQYAPWEYIEVLNDDQAGLQLRPRFAESKPITISIEQKSCGWSVSWSWQVIDLTKVSTGAECQSQCSCRGLLWFEVKNSWKLQGLLRIAHFMGTFESFLQTFMRGNAEAWGCHLRSAGVHQRGAKLCTFWIWDIFWRENPSCKMFYSDL